jgi:flagellar basal body-associated protein FliL
MDKFKKALMIIAIVAIVAITGSLIYYFVFFRPGIEKAEIRLQEQKAAEEVIRKENLEKCLKETEDWYKETLETFKNTKGLTTYDYEIAWKIIRDLYQDKKDACNIMYGK